MSLEILKDQIQPPAQNNSTWVFPIRGVAPGKDVEVADLRLASYDLNSLFKEAVGRCPEYQFTARDKLQDILANWDKVGPRLKQQFARTLGRD